MYNPRPMYRRDVSDPRRNNLNGEMDCDVDNFIRQRGKLQFFYLTDSERH